MPTTPPTDREALRNQRRGRALLGACQADVVMARAELREARHHRAKTDIEPFRENLVAALAEYAATIELSGAPLPRRVLDELRLYRRLGHRL